MEKIELNLALLNELIEEYEMFEETFCSERDRQIFAMGTSVEYLKGDKPNMYRAELTHNYRIGNGHKLEEHIRGMRRTLEYADTSLTELRQECERVGHTVGAFGSGAFSNMKFMYNDSVKNEIVNCSNIIYNESRMLYQTLMEINSEIVPIVEEDFSSQIQAGRSKLDQIRDFEQALEVLGAKVEAEINEIISQLCGCIETETLENNGMSDMVEDVEKRRGYDELQNSINIQEYLVGKVNGKEVKINIWENWGIVGGGAYNGKPMVDENGRYRIAVGPRIIDPNYSDDGKIWKSDIQGMPNIIKVTLKDEVTGAAKVIECVVVDIKAHTYNKYPDGHSYNTGDIAEFEIENGIVQTGIAYPNSWNAGKSEACATENIDASVIEFACGELDFNPRDYILENIEIVNE